MSAEIDLSPEHREWLATCFDDLTTEIEVLTPSQWTEKKRYLPSSASPMPGFYRFDSTPYLREIIDCLGVESPIREVAVMKGVQLGFTTLLESLVGYVIDHVKSAPVMLITATQDLAVARIGSYLIPMLKFSGLDHLIKSSDEQNNRKTGRTEKKLEWVGGGFMIPAGAQNPTSMRSWSSQFLLRDEVDGWPLVVGNDGCPLDLSASRCAAYESSRKIFDISTPTIKGLSKIEKRFKLGDQRYYYVCCLKCGFPQVLRWRRTSTDGVVSGIVWETQAGLLVPDSVRYLCQDCGHPHTNDDKVRLLSPDHGAAWKPTAQPSAPWMRSYHLASLYSPVGMATWESSVQKWLEAWDVERGRVKDVAKLQVVYNNIFGDTFEQIGERRTFEEVSAHRRQEVYHFGEIPNRWAFEFCGGPVLLLTCAVDVHADNLAVAVFGWCRDRRAILVDYWRFEGDTEQVDDPKTWGRLRKLIEDKEYTADDGKRYPIALTLVDSGYRPDLVYRFAAEYQAGVYPLKGTKQPPKSAAVKEFSAFTTPLGTTGYGVTVDLYKDRWSAALRRGWDGQELQPETFFNAPMDATDPQMKELTVETKHALIDPRTKLQIGWEWLRPSHAANELWDLLCYSNAALDLVAWNVCVGQLERPSVCWSEFYDLIAHQKLFFRE